MKFTCEICGMKVRLKRHMQGGKKDQRDHYTQVEGKKLDCRIGEGSQKIIP